MRTTTRFLRQWLTLTCLTGLLATPCSRADMAIIVHPQNPITSLSEDEVRQIYLGRMRMFPGTKQNIDPVDQDASLPPFERFYRLIANLTPTSLQRLRAMYLFSGKGLLPDMLKDEAAVIAFVTSHPDAIGYIDSTRLSPQVKSVLSIKE